MYANSSVSGDHPPASAPPSRLTRAEQQARTRAALIEAAAEVFLERGFRGTSVEAITARAGYSRGAFYSNFESKEQLFAELLQERAFSRARDIAARSADPRTRPTARELGRISAEVQSDPDTGWLFRLWLELLAHAGRDPEFRQIAAEFWRGTRALGALALEQGYRDAGVPPPGPPDHLATAVIALDVGLGLQRFVDPEAVPLSLYPELFELLFGPLEPGARPRRRARRS
jgi:AcrR family transcriptional regulator